MKAFFDDLQRRVDVLVLGRLIGSTRVKATNPERTGVVDHTEVKHLIEGFQDM